MSQDCQPGRVLGRRVPGRSEPKGPGELAQDHTASWAMRPPGRTGQERPGEEPLPKRACQDASPARANTGASQGEPARKRQQGEPQPAARIASQGASPGQCARPADRQAQTRANRRTLAQESSQEGLGGKRQP